MRITYVFDRPLPATETDSEQAVQTVAALARKGVDVTLVLPCKKGAGAAPDAGALRDYYRVRGDFHVAGFPQPFMGQSDARKIYHALFARERARGSDLLYTRNFLTLFAAATSDIPYAYETYRPWFDQFVPLRPLFRWALNAPLCVGAVLHSRFAQQRYANLGVDPARLLVAHNGYDPELMRSAPDKVEARRELGLPLDRQIVSYTGHVNATKGIDSIVQMATRVPEALFLLVGHDGKGGLIEHLARSVPNVRLVPWQPFERVAWYLKASDVLLLPPSNRGLSVVGNTVLPMKLFLYLAAGRPILAPRTSDVLELLEDGRNARLVPVGDVEAASKALRALLLDTALAHSLSESALHTSQDLTWDARADKLLGFLETALGRRDKQ